MKAIRLYKEGKLYFEGTCEIEEIEDIIIEPEVPEDPEEKIYLKDWIEFPEPTSVKARIDTKLPYYVFAGQSGNRYLWQEYRDILDLILRSLYETFKGTRESPFTGVYDACGNAEHLPAGTHAFHKTNGRTVDLSYWMLKGDNFTQQWNIPSGYSYNPLWQSALVDPHFVKTFDWERMITFVMRLKEVLPHATISVDERIRQYLYKKATWIYGQKSIEAARIKSLNGDPAGLYNHDKHMHIVLDTYRSVINWGLDISHWWR